MKHNEQQIDTIPSIIRWAETQVLSSTRDDDSRVRRRGLAVIDKMLEGLGEEYIILLPEAMPFLAELLEDPELNIQNATKILLKRLEDVSGESLDDYLRS